MMKGKVFALQDVNYCGGALHLAASFCRNDRTETVVLHMRKTLRLLTAAALLCVVFALIPGSRAEGTSASGDPTGDGALCAADAAAMLRDLAFGRDGALDLQEFDFTQNGEFDKTDARAALLFACGGIGDMAAFGRRVSTGLNDETIFDRFSYTGIKDDGRGNYQSDTVCVRISHGRAQTSDYHLADIYVQDIACIRTAFSGGKYKGAPTTVHKMFDAETDAVVAVNGDYYTQHYYGPVIRNGEPYLERVTHSWDIAVLLKSGELVTYGYRKLTKEALAELDVYQTWVFGPSLLDEEGRAKTRFRSAVQDANPRSVIGYFEPGHYAFLAVDGRSKTSKGLTMAELSDLCEDLGFTSAYNLDGGQSSVLYAKDGPVNNPYRDGRPISDVIAVCDPRTE
jgi:hypothetical protein